MSNEKKPRRRYFRRRKKGAKAEESVAPTAPKPKPKSRRRGGRRRSRSRRERELPIAVEPVEVEEVLPEPETSADEDVSVFVYTYVVRAQYRDAYSDYRSEHSLGEGHYETAHTRIMAQVTDEIQARVEAHFDQVESEGDTWKRPLSEFRQVRSDRQESTAAEDK